jgi:uncharacterized protein YeaO (DUF488 family)
VPVKVKRVYATPDDGDGKRVLVDRLWPRGVAKQAGRIDLWLKDVSPSTELRKIYHGKPDHWDEFCRAYAEELSASPGREALETLAELARGQTVTLLYAAREEERNNATALAAILQRCAPAAGRRATRSISTKAPTARPLTPTQVRAGRRSGGKKER